MAKGFPKMPGGMNNMLRQAQKMQENMLKLQEELEEKEYEVSSGGGMVTAKLNGKRELLELKINPEVIDADDVEMLEDLIIAAVNEGLRKVEEESAAQMSKLTGGLNIPGLF